MREFQPLLKGGLAVLLLMCLLSFPYGFFIVVRIIALVVFGILAMHAYEDKTETPMYIYIALAVLFQPFLKIPLGRDLWNIIDVLVAIGLVVSIFKARKQ